MTAHCLLSARRRPRVALGWLPLLGLALGACSGAPAGDMNPALGWSAAGSPKELEVHPAEYRHEVHFATDSARIDPAERDRLRGFLAAVGPGSGDAVRIEGHADERASDRYNLDLSARRARSVQEMLRQEGLREVPVHLTAYGERAPEVLGSGPEVWRENRRVQVVIDRHVVVLPPCPDWSVESGTDFANNPHSNFGCATRTNLGLMIDNPRDLARGRSLGPADGVREAEAIARYRRGEVTELKQEVLE